MAVKFPGSQAVVYVMREATYGTPRKPTGAEAIRTLQETFTPRHERDYRMDRTSTADYLEQVKGRYSADWSISKLILPNGGVTIMPDDFRLWDAGLGRTSTGATSVRFLQATAHQTSLTIRRGIRGDGTNAAEFQEHVCGAVVNKVDIGWGSQGQNNQAQVTFSGVAKRWGFTANSSLSSTGQLLTTALTITVDNAQQFTEGGVFCIKRQDGTNVDSAGGSGMLIGLVNSTTKKLTFTLASALSSTHSDNDLVRPWNPVPVTAGSPIHARLGRLSLDGSATTIKHLGGRITMENGLGVLNEEVGTDSASEVVRNAKYKTTVTLDFLMKREEVGALLGSSYNASHAHLQVDLGEQTGSIVEFGLGDLKWDMVSPNVPPEGDARVTMTGRAFGTNGQDSFWVKFK